MAPASARRNQQVFAQMPGKVLQHRMRFALGIRGHRGKSYLPYASTELGVAGRA